MMCSPSRGRCDGASPTYFADGEGLPGDHAVRPDGGGTPFYIGGPRFDDWKHIRRILGLVSRPRRQCSLENGESVRFLIRS